MSFRQLVYLLSIPTVILVKHNIPLTCVLTVLNLIHMNIIYVIIGTAFALLEGFVIQHTQHTWRYTYPDKYNIPYWLIPLWVLVVAWIHDILLAYQYYM